MTPGDRGSWVVLIHGYTDSAKRMFFGTGIAADLASNHRVVAIDNRNHGLSDKAERNAPGRDEDTSELMGHLGIQKAHIHGYSMGGGFRGSLLARHPDRFITAAFGPDSTPTTMTISRSRLRHAAIDDGARDAVRGGLLPSKMSGSSCPSGLRRRVQQKAAK